jgi:hypothetical protein
MRSGLFAIGTFCLATSAAALALASDVGVVDTATPNGGHDREATEIVLKRAARQVKDNCGYAKDENGVAKGPWGETTVTVVLGHGGRSKAATLPAGFEGTPTGRCVVAAFSRLTIPPFSGDDVTIEWPIDIPKPAELEVPEEAPPPKKTKSRGGK